MVTDRSCWKDVIGCQRKRDSRCRREDRDDGSCGGGGGGGGHVMGYSSRPVISEEGIHIIILPYS